MLPLIIIHAKTEQPLNIAMTQEQMKAVWARKVALQTGLRALSDLPENKRAISELKEGIDACNTELVSGTYNPLIAVD